MKRLLPLVLFLALAAPAHAHAADAGPLTVSGLTGTLIAPRALHGVAWVRFNASDPGGWLLRAVLSVDSTERSVRLDEGAGRSEAAVELTWDTTAVRDGRHLVSASVEDTARNVGFAFGPAWVTTDNEPPVAGMVAVTRSAQTVTATPSGFDGQDVEYTYRWQRCDPGCEDIDGATHARYALMASDANRAVRAVVTATDLGGSTTARSAQMAVGAVVPAATPNPTPPTGVATPDPHATGAGCAGRGLAAAAASELAAPATPGLAAPATPGLAAPASATRRALAGPAAGCPSSDAPVSAAAFATPAPLAAPFTAPPSPRVVLGWRTIHAGYGDRVEFTGHVTDSGGDPLAGVTLDVRSRLRVPRATARHAGVIVSGRDGRFTYALRPDASRDVTIGGSTVSLLVRAAGTFTATRTGRVVTLRGRLRGGHIPPGGVLIAVSAGRRVVRLTRTDARGAFAARVPAAALSFRAAARKDSSWPFVPVQLKLSA